jgi:two-component sensor histidine kinase
MYAKNQTVAVKIHAFKEHMPLEIMMQLGIIANELVTNSIKYAFEEQKGTITIELHHHGDNFTFVYYDEGIGSKEPEKLLQSKSLGIKLIHLATRQLHGTVKLSSPKGLRYDIEFKT